METLQNADCENMKDFNDSGVQDVGKQMELEDRPAELLDLSDDVLLGILKYCSPMDLKALGFTCPRLGRLIRDRTLWTHVDARAHRTGRVRLRWLLAHVLCADTVELKLQGHALTANGCLGLVNRDRIEVEAERQERKKEPTAEPGYSLDGRSMSEMDIRERFEELYAQSCATASVPPAWPDDAPTDLSSKSKSSQSENDHGPADLSSKSTSSQSEDASPRDKPQKTYPVSSCPGPQFTWTQCMLRQLKLRCSLTSLALEYCNINCNTTNFNHFPRGLKRLSLKGTKCYNLPLDRSFLFNIQEYLPEIEYMDLSECDWLEPASLLPLSKAPELKQLIMRDCHRMSEFVAYSSLAMRYGFKKLEILDVRGSPVADSEVSAFGFLTNLRELYVSPAKSPAPVLDHTHYRDEELAAFNELQPWEMQEPEYFKIKPQTTDPPASQENMTAEEIEQLKENLCLHGVDYNLCTEGAANNRQKSPLKRPSESSKDSTTEYSPQISPSDLIEAFVRRNQGNWEMPNELVVRRGRRGLPPRDEPAVVIKRTRFNAEDSSRNTGTSTNNAGEGSSKSESGCSNADSDAAKKVKGNIVINVGTSKKIDDPTCSKEGTSTNDRGEGSSKSEASSNANLGLSNSLRVQIQEGTILIKRKLEEPSRDVDNNEAGPSKKFKDQSNGEEKPGCSKDNNESPRPQNGAGTSKDTDDKSECSKPNEHPQDCKCKNSRKYEYVRFRQNRDPVIVRRDPAEVEREERGTPNENRGEFFPRFQAYYVNVGQQLHAVYRLRASYDEPPIYYSFSGNNCRRERYQPAPVSVYYTPPAPHLDATSLVTDSAVRRFGRPDVPDETVIHIGPRFGAGQGTRPNRSSLRVLSITGFRNITDNSLVHLATAAPELRTIDFSRTRVTARGVENFKILRPDCEVIFSEYVDKPE